MTPQIWSANGTHKKIGWCEVSFLIGFENIFIVEYKKARFHNPVKRAPRGSGVTLSEGMPPKNLLDFYDLSGA